MILKEWDDILKIRKFFIEKNFIETSYKFNNSELNNRDSVFFKAGRHKYARIIGIVQMNADDSNPSNVKEQYKKEYKYKNNIAFKGGHYSSTVLMEYLILITPDKKKITFAHLEKRGKHLSKVLAINDIVFERKLAKLEFNPSEKVSFQLNHSFHSLLEDDNDHIIREDLIEDLVEEKKKISIDKLQKNLNFHDTKKFHLQVLKWAKKFRLIIDGDYLIVNKDDLSIFLDELDRKYKEWEKIETKK